jgi:hypothetical protein
MNIKCVYTIWSVNNFTKCVYIAEMFAKQCPKFFVSFKNAVLVNEEEYCSSCTPLSLL